MPRDVDQTLFATRGGKDRIRNRSDGSAGLSASSALSSFYSGGGTSASPGGRRTAETLNLVTKDQVRTLKVPRKQSKGNAQSALVISWSEYSRLKEASKVLSKEERRQKQDVLEATRNDQAEQVKARRKEFEEIDRSRSAEPTQDDLEALERDQQIRENAKRMMEEQDDVIKKLDEYILQAKVQAVRDRQLHEKRQIKLKEEEMEYRLDMMMEEERIRAIKKAEDDKRALVEEKQIGRRELEEQIEERRQMKILEEELKEQEQRMLLEKIKERHQEDYEAAQQKRNEARVLMAQVAKSNEEAIAIRKAREEQERLEDEKLAQYIIEKARQEEEKEREAELAKAAHDRRQAKMIEAQGASLELEKERERIAMRRAEADALRKARQAEEAKAQKKAAARDELLSSLQEQRQRAMMEKAAMAEQEREDFLRTVRALEQVVVTEQATQDEKRTRRMQNRDEVLTQIQEKEREAIRNRQTFFEEGAKLDQEAVERKARLEAIKERKLAELRATGIDEERLQQVARNADRLVNQPEKIT